MSETKKSGSRDWFGAAFVAFVVAFIIMVLLGAACLGACGVTRRFERNGYVLIEGIDGEAVATVTPIFEEWRRE